MGTALQSRSHERELLGADTFLSLILYFALELVELETTFSLGETAHLGA